MSDVAWRLAALAQQEAVPLEHLLHRYLLHGVLRRWSRSGHAADLVLRGGLLTQLWVGPQRRETSDMDFLGLYPRDMEGTQDRLMVILKDDLDDEVSFDLSTLHGGVIWQETDFPGLRFVLQGCAAGREMDLQIDVGFGDPVVPPAGWIDYPCLLGASARVQAARPELMVAWKLHGLFEHGIRRWQPKDLYDLCLLTEHCALDPSLLSESIGVAFAAHNDPLEQVPGVLYSRDWWTSATARGKWTKFRATQVVPVPEDLLEVATAVARALRPALEQRIGLPADAFA
jgi:hypothetical protein